MLRTTGVASAWLVVVCAASLAFGQESAHDRNPLRIEAQRALERFAPEPRISVPRGSSPPAGTREQPSQAERRVRDTTSDRTRIAQQPASTQHNALSAFGAGRPYDYSSNRRYLVAAYRGGGLALWDTNQNELLRRLDDSDRRYSQVTISDDTRWIAARARMTANASTCGAPTTGATCVGFEPRAGQPADSNSRMATSCTSRWPTTTNWFSAFRQAWSSAACKSAMARRPSSAPRQRSGSRRPASRRPRRLRLPTRFVRPSLPNNREAGTSFKPCRLFPARGGCSARGRVAGHSGSQCPDGRAAARSRGAHCEKGLRLRRLPPPRQPRCRSRRQSRPRHRQPCPASNPWNPRPPRPPLKPQLPANQQ